MGRLTMYVWRCLITALVVAPVLVATAPARANKFDGRWNVVLTTDVGACEASIAAVFTVKKDDIAADSASSLKADGAVESNGAMWVRFTAGQDNYRGQGRLTAAGGSGVWSSGSRYCGGKWRAVRER